jgi:hypothetical protein
MIPVVLAALLIGGVVGAAVVNHDDERGDRVVQITTQPAEPGQAPQVVTIDGGDHWRGGFFPFGFIFPILWIGLIIFLISFFWRGGRGRHGGPGGWEGRFEEWHRRQHQSGNNEPPATGAASA